MFYRYTDQLVNHIICELLYNYVVTVFRYYVLKQVTKLPKMQNHAGMKRDPNMDRTIQYYVIG